ncbi:MAG: filamentous hemagglutinin N-terminal domain-containing protein [Methylococcales bacterium]|nr:filamentous hemagglutinin N-terminal domain-containing protein [Methylococcales bacterium]
MNHIYRSIWSESLATWIAVSENTKGKAKNSSKRNKYVDVMTASPLKDWQSSTPLLATSLLLCSSAAWALPTGDQLIAGQVTINTPTAGQMQIDQTSQQAIINWQGFSIAPNEAVNIQQPNAQAALLNRVVGQDASQIQGQLHANGQVYLVNPNGVLFGKSAQVDVGGLIASTHNIKDSDFLNGIQHFTQDNATGTVDNQGTINVPDGGVVALIGSQVSNTGSITAPKGTAIFAAGKTVDLDFKGDGLVEVKVSEAALNAQITNKGAIQADGGRVVLTAKAAGQLIDTVINQDGIIRAQGLVSRNGEIILEGGTVTQTGTLDVSGQTGGTISINANTLIDSGTSNADGSAGGGGKITLTASDTITQTAVAHTHADGTTTGGTVHLAATNSVTSSGKLSATGEQGGTIDVIASNSVTLTAAKLDASGTKKGGLIRVGGDFHGANMTLANAKTTRIDSASTLTADGGKGQVVVWSDQQTDYYGSISANKVGSIEVSSKGLLNYAGAANAGVGGSLLLDPKNIIISSGVFSNQSAGSVFFANNIGQTTTIATNDGPGGNPPFGLTTTLQSGTNVILQANNDITLQSGADIFVTPTAAIVGCITTPAHNGGNLTLQAGRNITLNASITTGNGGFTAIAGDPNAIAADRDLGIATLTLGAGASINTGTGNIVLTAIEGKFVNNSGSTTPLTANQWTVYSTDPAQNILNGMTAPNKHYAQPYTGTTPAYATTGNWFLYSITPVLSVTPSSQTIGLGGTIDNFTPASFSGFINGDTSSTAGITGIAEFSVGGFFSQNSIARLANTAGSYDVAYLRGLASSLGYLFSDNTASINELTVNSPPTTTIIPPVIPIFNLDQQISSLQTSTVNAATPATPYSSTVPDSDLTVDDKRKPTFAELKMKNSAGRVKRLQLSANKQFLSLLLEDGSVRIWDFQRGVQRKIVTGRKEQALTDISAVDDKGELLSISSTAGIGPHDIISSMIDDKLAIDGADINHFVTTDDGRLLLMNTGDHKLSLWDTKLSKERWSFDHERGVVNNLALSNDQHYGAVLSRQAGVYAVTKDNKAKSITDAIDIIDLATGKIVKSLANAGENLIYMRFKNNDTLSVGSANGMLSDWSIATGSKKPAGGFQEDVDTIDNIKETYTYVAKDGTVRVGNAQGHIQLSVQNKENPIKFAKLLEDGKKLLTVLANGDSALWDVATGKKILRLYSSLQGWTVMDEFGRFDGSDDSIENFSWMVDEKNEIPLDSFSENYYEPGLLTNVLQNQAYLNSNPNRVDEGFSLPPKVDLQLAEQQTTGDKVALKLDVYDRGGGIDKIQLYHNGKLISNEEAVITKSTSDDAEHRMLALNISPSAGKNTLKVVASNDMGIENSSSEISFDGKTKAYQSAVRLMTVGINKYSDHNLNLHYSVADANLIGTTIKNNSNMIASKVLINEKATKPQILAELKELSQGVQQDVLVIYFAGHGMALGKEWYFLPHETKLEPTAEQIATYGITSSELSDIFKNSKIQHILLMVDACYSGAGLNAFSKLENGQRYLSRRLSRSLGITVIAAATKDQEAMELKSLGHGLFTYLIAEEIDKKNTNEPITAHSIADNIAKTLPAVSKKMLGSSQDPAVYTKGNDFMLTDLLKGKK